MNEFTIHFFKTGFAVIFLLLVDFIIEFLLNRNVKNRKKSIKLRVAFRYVLVFFFFFFMAKIWVEGFGYLITFIGFIAAALTITQKEYLMNIFGWLIIMWRDLFVEGDYIEIGKYSGYVTAIAPLYFSIAEASDSWGSRTGKIIKIPNSLIATHPVVNFMKDDDIVEGKILYTFTMGSSVEKIHHLTQVLEKEIGQLIQSLSQQWNSYQQDEFSQSQKIPDYAPEFSIRVYQDKPPGVQLKMRYLSLKENQKIIENKAFEIIMNAIKDQPDLALTVMS